MGIVISASSLTMMKVTFNLRLRLRLRLPTLEHSRRGVYSGEADMF